MLLKEQGGYRQSVRVSDTRHKYDSALAEYLDLNIGDWADQSSGDVDFPGGWFAPVGAKRIVRSDDRGFVWVEKYGNEFERDLVLNALSDWYYAWSFEEEEGTEVGAAQRANYVAYVYECDRDGVLPYSFNAWRTRGLS